MATTHSAKPRDAAEWFERADRRYRFVRAGGAAALMLLGLALLVTTTLSSRDRAPVSGDSLPVEWNAAIQRLERVEAENLYLKLAAGIALLGTGAFVLLGSVLRLHTVEAGRILLRDRRGRLRVGLTPEAGLVFLDAEQRPRVELSTYHDTASLKLFDATRQRRIELSETPDGALLAISDATTKPRVALLGVSRDGPALALTDTAGAANFAITGDGPNVVLHHRTAGRGTLEVTDEGPRLLLAERALDGQTLSLSPASGDTEIVEEPAVPYPLNLAS